MKQISSLLLLLLALLLPALSFAGTLPQQAARALGKDPSIAIIEQATGTLAERTYWSLFGSYDTPTASDLDKGGFGTGIQVGYEITPLVSLEISAAFADPAYVDGEFQFQSSTSALVLYTAHDYFFHGFRPFSIVTAGGDFAGAGESFLYAVGGGFEYKTSETAFVFADLQHVWRTDSENDSNWSMRAGLRMRF